ncbi:hypothetical protein OH76DRAFT_901883 [Lentinus brumalis]|uniref:Uncharacterized protein n=1 Tax=Lentinus brumalis TaxID=2498619 RepID=A0A371D0X5_9APHY|nr:hypothetical protein OH76DRAFT_901883 [Polyporus brumalis]
MEELEALTGSQGLRDDIRSLAAPLRRLIAWYGPMHCFPAAKPMVLLEPFWSTLQKWDLSVIQCEEETLEASTPVPSQSYALRRLPPDAARRNRH